MTSPHANECLMLVYNKLIHRRGVKRLQKSDISYIGIRYKKIGPFNKLVMFRIISISEIVFDKTNAKALLWKGAKYHFRSCPCCLSVVGIVVQLFFDSVTMGSDRNFRREAC